MFCQSLRRRSPAAVSNLFGRRPLSDAASKPKGDTPFPLYLRALFGTLAVGGATVVGVLILTHEPGIRYAVESVAPALVELVREKSGFRDEDPVARAETAKITREMASSEVSVRLNGSVKRAQPSETLATLREEHDQTLIDQLDIVALDESSELEYNDDDADETLGRTVAFDLERRCNLHGAPSLWSPAQGAKQKPSSAEVDAERRRELGILQSQRDRLDQELRSGRRTVDDTHEESTALDGRIRALTAQVTPRRFFLSALF